MILNNFSEDELIEILKEKNIEKYRADQIFRYIHNRRAKGIDEMTQLPKAQREILKEDFELESMKILEVFSSELDETKKMLYLLSDKNLIEGVLMKYKYGNTLCVSTQVGCRMGCSFCASTKKGLERNLSPSEIVSQVYLSEEKLGVKISNIVLMGSGEPLDNYENVMKALEILHDPKGKNMSYRNMTLSTCGIPDKILKLAAEEKPISIAISAHSFSNEIRKKLMPITKKYSIDEVMDAVKEYNRITNDRISIEYTVIPKTNDRDEDILLFKKYLGNLNCVINLIALNPIVEYNNREISGNFVIKFKEKLINSGFNTTIRRELGRDISASCGQLKINYLNSVKEVNYEI